MDLDIEYLDWKGGGMSLWSVMVTKSILKEDEIRRSDWGKRLNIETKLID
ncbi:hypothetical protein DEAC_c23980 [Desulfosporosinus acididurans]|uniref:Uncharacterized protein n=1 Tax=Desulfosporosinus acididurans TaxID=476652 RepID=A0A0J1FRZ2_9FIRM|nr:hypothetical protein DEAC_c23980 [Desulfosporosinus acididurans]